VILNNLFIISCLLLIFQPQVEYHKDFELTKEKIHQVADTLEMKRVQTNTKNLSVVYIVSDVKITFVYRYMYIQHYFSYMVFFWHHKLKNITKTFSPIISSW